MSKEVSRWRSEWQATDKEEMKVAMYQLPEGEAFALGKRVPGELYDTTCICCGQPLLTRWCVKIVSMLSCAAN